jgi:hypothetical protein
MGCTSSVPVEVASPEPVPSYEILLKTKIQTLPKEPQLSHGDDNHTSEEAVPLIFRKIKQSGKGDTFQVETMEDALFHKLQIRPAKPGIVGSGLKGRFEDLVFLHEEDILNRGIGFAIKNVPKGLNYYQILTPTPLRDTQKPVKFQGPSFCDEMFLFADVKFNIKSNVVSVKLSGQAKDAAPVYSMRQCNEKVWVVKKQNTVCAAFQQVRGMAQLTCYRALVCAGVDPAFMSLLFATIDSFLAVAKTQRWKLYDNRSVETIDWPELDQEMEEKLFGKAKWSLL